MKNTITLSDVLSRDLSLYWYEAVALVLAVAGRLDAASAAQRIPDLNQIVLSEDGTIEVSGGVVVDNPVARLGQLLQVLLAEMESPVQLRLLISQATAPVPSYASVREYADALAYFERPNRPAVLQALYVRAAAAPASAAAKRPPTLDSLVTQPAAERAADRKKKSARLRTAVRAAAAVAAGLAIAVVATASTQYLRTRGSSARGASLSHAVARASDAVDRAAMSGASAVTERLGLGRLVRPGSTSEPPAPRPRETAAPTPHPRAARHVKHDPQRLVAFDLEAPPVIAASVRSRARGSDLPRPAPDERDPSDPADGAVYSSDSGDVFPPVGLRPQLPRELPAGIDREKLARIELVVGADGSVDSVKLLDPPRDVTDAMFLSVAKAWEFRPALKDGVPVRYRKTIWIIQE